VVTYLNRDFGSAIEGIERGGDQKIAVIPDGGQEDWVVKHDIPKRLPSALRAVRPR